MPPTALSAPRRPSSRKPATTPAAARARRKFLRFFPDGFRLRNIRPASSQPAAPAATTQPTH